MRDIPASRVEHVCLSIGSMQLRQACHCFALPDGSRIPHIAYVHLPVGLKSPPVPRKWLNFFFFFYTAIDAMVSVGELSKADKRKLKFERKQARLRAEAEAAGAQYHPPAGEQVPTQDKVGKRRKRKLRELEQQAASVSAVDAEPAKQKSAASGAQEPAANGAALAKRKAARQAAVSGKGAADAAMADAAGHSEAGQQGHGAAKANKKEQKAFKRKQQEVSVIYKAAWLLLDGGSASSKSGALLCGGCCWSLSWATLQLLVDTFV